eukprot:gene16920-biopygen791
MAFQLKGVWRIGSFPKTAWSTQSWIRKQGGQLAGAWSCGDPSALVRADPRTGGDLSEDLPVIFRSEDLPAAAAPSSPPNGGGGGGHPQAGQGGGGAGAPAGTDGDQSSAISDSGGTPQPAVRRARKKLRVAHERTAAAAAGRPAAKGEVSRKATQSPVEALPGPPPACGLYHASSHVRSACLPTDSSIGLPHSSTQTLHCAARRRGTRRRRRRVAAGGGRGARRRDRPVVTVAAARIEPAVDCEGMSGSARWASPPPPQPYGVTRRLRPAKASPVPRGTGSGQGQRRRQRLGVRGNDVAGEQKPQKQIAK